MLYYSLGILTVGLAETIQNLTPFITLLIGFVVLNETMRVLEIVNMVISFLGVVVIILFSSNQSELDVHQGMQGNATVWTYLLGITANTLSAVFFAIDNVILRSLKDVDVVALSAIHSSICLVIGTLINVIYRTIISPNQFNYGLDTF